GRLAGDGGLEATVGGRTYRAEIVRTGNRLEVFYAGRHLRLTCEDRDQPGSHEELGSGRLVAPMPGRVISVLVGRDSGVEKGQALMV
ncbi:MAG: 3-methylcrotonyl-CoA carboxylase, partial [Gammaproteobacteria bacterium]|nr:3-methylcrotonyl-CoA carboxylase [Gammaproteobacteria bacterium]